jgi:hypothetical protein
MPTEHSTLLSSGYVTEAPSLPPVCLLPQFHKETVLLLSPERVVALGLKFAYFWRHKAGQSSLRVTTRPMGMYVIVHMLCNVNTGQP